MKFSETTGLSRGNEIWIYGSEGTLRVDDRQNIFVGRRGDNELAPFPNPPEGQAATDHTDVNINHVELEWCMNRRTFDKLPHDLKVVVNNWARANFQAESQQVFLKLAVIARNKFKKEGMKFHSLTDAEAKRWAEAYENVTQDYLKKTEAKGLPARELVADIKALVEQYKGKTFNELMLETINDPDQSFSRGVK